MKSMRMDFTVDKAPRFSRRERDYYKLYNFEPPSTANVPTLEDLIGQYKSTIVKDPFKDDLKFKLEKPARFSRLERTLELKPVHSSKLSKDIVLADAIPKEIVTEGGLRRATYINVNVDSPPKFSRSDRESMLLMQDLPPEVPSGPVHDNENLQSSIDEILLPPLDVSIVSPPKFSRQERLLYSPPFVPAEKSICEREIEFMSSIYSEIPVRLQLGKKHKKSKTKEKSTYMEGQSGEFESFVRSRAYSPPNPFQLPPSTSSLAVTTSNNSHGHSNGHGHVRPNSMSGPRVKATSRQQQQPPPKHQHQMHVSNRHNVDWSSTEGTNRLKVCDADNSEDTTMIPMMPMIMPMMIPKDSSQEYGKYGQGGHGFEHESNIRPSTCPTFGNRS